MVALGVLALAVEAGGLWRSGYGLGGEVIVRCRDGHLFRTLWIPGVSVKALRLGWWRVQRCPVGAHWTLVSPVARDALSAEQIATAQAAHDARLP